jgi:hypothetical protein
VPYRSSYVLCLFLFICFCYLYAYCLFYFCVLIIPLVFVVVGRMVINTYILILRIPDVRCLLAYNIIYTHIGGQVLSFLICRVVVICVCFFYLFVLLFCCCLYLFVLLFLKSSHFEVW